MKSKGLPMALAVAMLAAAVLAVPLRAQETPQDLKVDETKKAGSAFQALKDFGSFGPSFGGMKLMGGDLGTSKTRPIVQGVFRYRFSDKWVGVGEFGFGWSSFKAKDDTVLTFTFGTLGVARRFSHRWNSDFRWTVGGGFYRWTYKWRGASLRDRYHVMLPDSTVGYGGSQLFYKGFVPGGYIGMEGERRLTRHVTFTTAVQEHLVLTSDSKFDRLFDTNYAFFSFRVGVNYHFSPVEGILWQRSQSHTIRLESGKEGK